MQLYESYFGRFGPPALTLFAFGLFGLVLILRRRERPSPARPETALAKGSLCGRRPHRRQAVVAVHSADPTSNHCPIDGSMAISGSLIADVKSWSVSKVPVQKESTRVLDRHKVSDKGFMSVGPDIPGFCAERKPLMNVLSVSPS